MKWGMVCEPVGTEECSRQICSEQNGTAGGVWVRDRKESLAACAETSQASLACWTRESCSETTCLKGQGQNQVRTSKKHVKGT